MSEGERNSNEEKVRDHVIQRKREEREKEIQRFLNSRAKITTNVHSQQQIQS